MAVYSTYGQEHPTLGRILENPSLIQTKSTLGDDVTSRHLADLDIDVQSTHTIAAKDFRGVPMQPGDQAIYILRDVDSGAILKVGIAENHLGRATQYSNAGNKLGLSLEMDVAIVRPGEGRTIRDVESSLAARLSDEGHIMPWDNSPTGRLGRSDRGTPFVHPVSKDLMWDAHGNLVRKDSGAPPPPSQRTSRPRPEELAQLIHQGKSRNEIAEEFGVHPDTITRWRRQSRAEIDKMIATMQEAETAVGTNSGGDGGV